MEDYGPHIADVEICLPVDRQVRQSVQKYKRNHPSLSRMHPSHRMTNCVIVMMMLSRYAHQISSADKRARTLHVNRFH